MLEKETVFILGAGASWHYNYPTGADLVNCLIDKAKIIIKQIQNPNALWRGDVTEFLSKTFPKEIRQKENNVIKFLDDFISRLKHVDPPVIDYFLAWNSDLQGIGQMLIAWEILDREREYEKEHINANHQRIDDKPINCSKFKDNWYRFILYKMLSNCENAHDVITNNHVSFITFNYDVSLETYLYRGLKNIDFFNSNIIDENQIKNFLAEKFCHVYDSVRRYPFVVDIPLIADNNAADIRNDNREFVRILQTAYEASLNIKTIGGSKDIEGCKEFAFGKIESAYDVYILGYGFDDNNNKHIGLNDLLSTKGLKKLSYQKKVVDKKNVFFSNFGDINSVNKKAAQLFTNQPQTFLPDKPLIHRKNIISSNAHSVTYEKSTKNVYDALEKDFNFY